MATMMIMSMMAIMTMMTVMVTMMSTAVMIKMIIAKGGSVVPQRMLFNL